MQGDERPESLVARILKTPPASVSAVMCQVDRKHFLPAALHNVAYKDAPLLHNGIHHSAPHIYAMVLEAIESSSKPGMSFLNIGSGTGYLSVMVGLLLQTKITQNHGIELLPEVVEFAQNAVATFNIPMDIKFECGNAFKLVTKERYDVIYVGAACHSEEIARFFTQFLTPEGLLYVPIGNEFRVITLNSTAPCFPCKFSEIILASQNDPPLHFRSVLPPTIINGGNSVITINHADEKAVKTTTKEREDTIKKEHSILKTLAKTEAHPNIIKVYDLINDRDGPRLILEKLHLSLHDIDENVTSERWLTDPLKLVTIAHDCAQGLYHIHSHDVLHLDIKPANIMVTTEYRAKLIDFGSAINLKSKPMPKQVGTAEYRDSGRLNTGNYGMEVDIYSLGKVFEEMKGWCVYFDYPQELAPLLSNIAEACTHPTWECRPTSEQLASEVVKLFSVIKVDAEVTMPYNTTTPLAESSGPVLCAQEFVQSEEWSKSIFAKQVVLGTVNIGTWNLLQFGNTVAQERIDLIVQAILDADLHIVTFQEVLTATALNRVVQGLSTRQNNPWYQVVSERVGENAERIAYIWRAPAIIQAWALPTNDRSWIRRPFYAKFHVGKTRFLLCSTHIKATPHSEVGRINAFVRALQSANHMKDSTNVLVMGDFNLQPDHAVWHNFAQQGWSHLLPASLKTNFLQTQSYDNIFIQKKHQHNVKFSLVSRPPAGVTNSRQFSDHCLVYAGITYVKGSEFPTSLFRPLAL